MMGKFTVQKRGWLAHPPSIQFDFSSCFSDTLSGKETDNSKENQQKSKAFSSKYSKFPFLTENIIIPASVKDGFDVIIVMGSLSKNRFSEV